MCILFALGLCAYVDGFDRPYDLPQVLSLFALACLMLAGVLARFGFALGALAAGCGVAVATLFPSPPFAVGAVCLLLALGALTSTCDERLRGRLRSVLIAVALLQAALALLSYLPFKTLALERPNGAPIGTVGNPDFLATVLAAALFFVWGSRTRPRLRAIAAAVLLAGLLATRARGTIALSAVLLLAPLVPVRLRLRIAFASVFATAAAAPFFWDKFAGRAQLWWVAAKALVEHPFGGVGVGRFSSAYFNSNLEFMRENAWFRATFGPWSSQVSDAHNLVLQWGAEAGFVAAGAAFLALYFGTKRAREFAAPDRNVALMLAFKSLYTVVWTSTQAIAVGSLAWESRRELSKRQLVAISAALGLAGASFVPAASVSHSLYGAMRLLRADAPELALSYIASAEAVAPDNTDAILAESFAFMKLGRCLEAREAALRASSIRQDMDVFKRAGHILFECAHYPEALALFEPLNVVFPEHRTTAIKIAWIKYRQGLWTEARSMAESSLAMRPRRASSSDERNLRDARRIVRLTEPPVKPRDAGAAE